MYLQKIFRKAICFLAMALLAGCELGGPPPQVGEIQAQRGTTITTGEEASLTIAADGNQLKFEWTTQRGTLSDSAQPAVIYTAPDSPGTDTVTVKVTYSGGQIVRSIIFDVVAPPTPTVTETPLPADTPTATSPATPTAAPPPTVCNHPSVTGNLFPQLEDLDGQFPMYGPEGDPNILCQAVYDIVHTPGSMAVHFRYQNVGPNFGWWGVATPNGYDASKHRQLCFWAYTQTPNQSFRFKVKDTTGAEKGIVTTIEKSNEWQEICADISDFAAMGLQMDRMDNVNLGFEQPTGSSEIWIADFEFK
jgi:hypothetical protein